ncbi:class I SAM-dependent methyltransferase [Plantibacter sp. YIM 135249]|uniref:class I SAM-dependent methyltransferase n=1 Tax=Plantibacter sp. YIM 135249 TaxID=3423918 RepID=UPI003D331312
MTGEQTVDRHEGEWLDRNLANWDERVAVHLGSGGYDLTRLRAGRGGLNRLEEHELAELFPVADGADASEQFADQRILHLQCHFGADTLSLAQRGATVVGIDFSHEAVLAARNLARELGLSDHARFIEANVYDARHILPEPESFDVVYITWGTTGWLPDIAEWARIIEWYLKPGGVLYYADGHPTAYVFEGGAVEAGDDGAERVRMLDFAFPYGKTTPDVIDDPSDYADGDARLANSTTWEWMHPVSELFGSLRATGLTIDRLAEHYEVPWKMFDALVPLGEGMWGWREDARWLPLALSIVARKPSGGTIR